MLTVDEVIQYIGNLNPMQLVSLTKELEEKWGVKAVPQVTQSVVSTKPETKEEVATEVNVVLTAVPADKKVPVIKILREIISVGLLEAKAITEALPKVLREAISREEAEFIAAKLTEAGGVVEIK